MPEKGKFSRLYFFVYDYMSRRYYLIAICFIIATFIKRDKGDQLLSTEVFAAFVRLPKTTSVKVQVYLENRSSFKVIHGWLRYESINHLKTPYKVRSTCNEQIINADAAYRMICMFWYSQRMRDLGKKRALGINIDTSQSSRAFK